MTPCQREKSLSFQPNLAILFCAPITSPLCLAGAFVGRDGDGPEPPVFALHAGNESDPTDSG